MTNYIRRQSGDIVLSTSKLLETKSTESLMFFVSKFAEYSFDLCHWTDLIELPKRSIIPSLLATTRRRKARGMTNWASYLLPGLALYNDDDPLSLALAAYTALRMQQKSFAVAFYIKVVRALQALLRGKDPATIRNEEFLRIWTATLLLSEYELVLANYIAHGKHIYGATTLAFIAASRFECDLPTSIMNAMIQEQARMTSESAKTPIESETYISTRSKPCLMRIDRPFAYKSASETQSQCSVYEALLPGYLLDLTRARRNASQCAETIDVEWPRFKRPGKTRQVCQDLLDIAACAYTHVMPLIQDFYTDCYNRASPHSMEYSTAIKALEPRYIEARKVLDRYKSMLSELTGPEYEVERGPTESNCPFSPIIRFSSPHMAHVCAMADIYMCLLAPFLSEAEHTRSLRYVSGIFAYMQNIDGLKSSGALPDLLIAAFWKAGPEREYFHNDLSRRKGDFMLCLGKIWATVDTIGITEHREVSKTEILRIALDSFRSAMIEGFKLQHVALWQILSMTMDPWAVAVGSVNPLESDYATDEEKERRRDFADVSHFHRRISSYRQHHAVLPAHYVEHSAPSRSQLFPKQDSLSDADTKSSVKALYEGLEYRGPDTFEDYDDSVRTRMTTTETGRIASRVLMHDPDRSKVYYII